AASATTATARPDPAGAVAAPADDATPATPATPAGRGADHTAATPATPAAPANPAAPAAPATPTAGDQGPGREPPARPRAAAAEVAPPTGIPVAGTAVPRPAAAAAAAAAPAAAVADPALPPHAQVAGLARSFLRRPDGTYRVALRLTPEHLGVVHVELELSGTDVALRLGAESAAARDALVAGADRLRADLEAAGLSATLIDVTGEGAGASGRRLGAGPNDDPRRPRGRRQQAAGPAAAPAPSVPTEDPAGAGHLNVRL
ncbi:MAG TPA: flagellar hook-length control protein FliK, partial [Acidimicrobiales bacterium]|nr:flagellar hook-length control protein FliK [Acidimicrobiales bacterium]